VSEIEVAVRDQAVLGTVLSIALLISGSQVPLFAMWLDMESNKDLR